MRPNLTTIYSCYILTLLRATPTDSSSAYGSVKKLKNGEIDIQQPNRNPPWYPRDRARHLYRGFALAKSALPHALPSFLRHSRSPTQPRITTRGRLEPKGKQACWSSPPDRRGRRPGGGYRAATGRRGGRAGQLHHKEVEEACREVGWGGGGGHRQATGEDTLTPVLPAARAAGRSSRGCHRAVRTLPPAAPILMR